MSTAAKKGKIVLNEDKTIGGKEYKSGIVMATFECAGKFDCQEVDKAMQMGQVTLFPGEDGKK